jgi:anti-anti-sigma factor
MDTASSVRQPAGRDGARHFHVERRLDADGTVRLILRGELDLDGQDELREALRAEQRSGAGVVVVLDQLDYLDSAGIGELVDSCDRARADGRRFAVTPGSGNVRRVLWISGVLSRLCDAGTDPSARHHP